MASSQGHWKWHNPRVQTQLTSDLFITVTARRREAAPLSADVSQGCESGNADICQSSVKHFEAHKPEKCHRNKERYWMEDNNVYVVVFSSLSSHVAAVM